MPIDLVLVRHGQSEQNLANHFAKQDDNSLFTPAFRDRHASQHRLTSRGREQALAAGDWLRNNGFGQFDRRYASTYIRAVETAGLLGVSGPDWMLEASLREREWGEFDGLTWEEREQRSAKLAAMRDTDTYYWIPPSGESIAMVVHRLRTSIVDTLHRECSSSRVIIVCHGEVMWAFRALLERMTVERWTQLEASKEPGAKIFNCQILHYTRRDPATGALADRQNWMRSVSPADPSNDGRDWETIVRPRFSNEQLLQVAEAVPHLFPDHVGY